MGDIIIWKDGSNPFAYRAQDAFFTIDHGVLIVRRSHEPDPILYALAPGEWTRASYFKDKKSRIPITLVRKQPRKEVIVEESKLFAEEEEIKPGEYEEGESNG
jgi:hypothetical protein